MAGNVPIKEDLTLTRGADFLALFKKLPTDPDIPSGTSARIEITQTNLTSADIEELWEAKAVHTDSIEFRIESEEADLVPSGWRYRLIVSFPDSPTLEHCWYYGSIKRVQ